MSSIRNEHDIPNMTPSFDNSFEKALGNIDRLPNIEERVLRRNSLIRRMRTSLYDLNKESDRVSKVVEEKKRNQRKAKDNLLFVMQDTKYDYSDPDME